MSRMPRECREKRHTRQKKKTKDFLKLKKLKGQYKRKRKALSLPRLPRLLVLLLFPSFRALLFSFTRSLPLLVSSSRSPLLQIYSVVTGRPWSLLVVLGARWCCSLSQSLFVSLISLARCHSRSTRWSLLAARLSLSTMFSPAANLQSLSPCKFQLPAHPHAPIVRSALRALILFLFSFLPILFGSFSISCLLPMAVQL